MATASDRKSEEKPLFHLLASTGIYDSAGVSLLYLLRGPVRVQRNNLPSALQVIHDES